MKSQEATTNDAHSFRFLSHATQVPRATSGPPYDPDGHPAEHTIHANDGAFATHPTSGSRSVSSPSCPDAALGVWVPWHKRLIVSGRLDRCLLSHCIPDAQSHVRATPRFQKSRQWRDFLLVSELSVFQVLLGDRRRSGATKMCVSNAGP